jgi:Fic family protein
MTILAYNLSSKIKDNLQKIEVLRRQILLLPVPPKTALRLRWEASLQRTYWSLVLGGNPLSKTDIIKLLSTQSKKRLTSEQKEVVNYKKTLDYIKEDWLVSSRTVSLTTIKKLYDLACKPTLGTSTRANVNQKKLQPFIDYLQAGKESPIIQAGIAQISTINADAFGDGNGSIARLVPYLYLYKHGYDFRGLLVLDEYLRKDLISLKQAIESVGKNKNLTLWLEYFTHGVLTQLGSAYKAASSLKFQTDLPAAFWKLNDRQIDILNSLEQPGAKITNMKVQGKYKVSQITASRDLSKLVKLGLLFSHGKGRSAHYTKV